MNIYIIKINFHFQVGLVRTPSQLGLIQARLAGARAATGSFIVFLDSHCEATKGWLEPMAQRMKEDPTVVQIPRSANINMMVLSLLLVRIDMIDSSTLSYYGSGSGSVSVGGFTWSGHFTWEGLPAKVETIIFSSLNNLLSRWQPRESQQIQQRLPQWPEGSLPLTETSFGRLVSHQCDISLSLTSQLGGRLRRGDGRLGR